MISGRRSRTWALMARKPVSREPQSCSIAVLTLKDVVRGPGVNRSGSPVSDAPRTKASTMRSSLRILAFPRSKTPEASRPRELKQMRSYCQAHPVGRGRQRRRCRKASGARAAKRATLWARLPKTQITTGTRLVLTALGQRLGGVGRGDRLDKTLSRGPASEWPEYPSLMAAWVTRGRVPHDPNGAAGLGRPRLRPHA